MGNVGETEETIDETIEFLQRINIDLIGAVGGGAMDFSRNRSLSICKGVRYYR